MNINKILKEQIELIKPNTDIFRKVKKTADEFCIWLGKRLKKQRVKAEVFIGGSLAKNTLVKKDKYDADIFVRFEDKYPNRDISKILGKGLGSGFRKIHGSRDYYQLIREGIILEIVPVIKIKKPEQAQNITDLSYFHVNYVLKKIRKEKGVADEIILAKTFAYAQNCYGAESYIHGFSGYALELLICHYGGFLKFIRQVSKSDNQKIIIDDSRFYKNRPEILRELNESKLNSPIILIDPTFKDRNILAGLSKETFLKFKEVCLEFLNNPSKEFFEKKDVSKELKKKYGKKLKIVSVKTNKQAGDISGAKSNKFFEFFKSQLAREFKIKISEFEYNEKQNISFFYFVLEKREDEIVKGPHITKAEHLSRFKKVHPKAFIKNQFAYARIEHKFSFSKFFRKFKRKYKRVMGEMNVKRLELSN